MIDAAQLAKFRRRAKFIATQEHLDRAMFLFPVEHHEEIAAQIQPLLTKPIIARKVDALPEIKFKDPDNPTLHESTVQRLNNMAAEVDRVKSQQMPLLQELATTKAIVETHAETIEALKAQRDEYKAQVDEKDALIAAFTNGRLTERIK